MSILSITFHTVESQMSLWEKFLHEELQAWIDNSQNIHQYVLSNVDTEMLTEGKNTNLLLFFENQQKREEFTATEFMNIDEKIALKFGENVMIFKTELNPIRKKI